VSSAPSRASTSDGDRDSRHRPGAEVQYGRKGSTKPTWFPAVDHAPPEGGDECRNFGRSHSARGRAFGSEPIRRLCREEGCAGREGCHLMDRVLVDPVPRSAGCMDERCWAGHAFVPRPRLPELSVGQQVTWRSPGGSSATIPAASSARAQGNDGICSPRAGGMRCPLPRAEQDMHALLPQGLDRLYERASCGARRVYEWENRNPDALSDGFGQGCGCRQSHPPWSS